VALAHGCAAPPPLAEASGPQTPWVDRLNDARQLWSVSVPAATAKLNPPEAARPEQNLPILADFQRLVETRERELDRVARHEAPPRIDLAVTDLSHQVQTAPSVISSVRTDVFPSGIARNIAFVQEDLRTLEEARALRRMRTPLRGCWRQSLINLCRTASRWTLETSTRTVLGIPHGALLRQCAPLVTNSSKPAMRLLRSCVVMLSISSVWMSGQQPS